MTEKYIHQGIKRNRISPKLRNLPHTIKYILSRGFEILMEPDEWYKFFRFPRLLLNAFKPVEWYQSIGINGVVTNTSERARIRTERVMKYIPMILKSNDKVLDIGCNAGLYSLTAAQTCKEVRGVDIREIHIKQANFIKSMWEKKGKRVSNVTFKLCDILKNTNLIKNFDVIFVCKILYLLAPDIHNFMDAIKNSNVRAVLIQGHVTQPKYNNIENITKLFDEYGFQTTVLENIPEYPILLAIRKGGKIDKNIKPNPKVYRKIEFHKNFDIKKYKSCNLTLKNIDQKKLKFEEYKNVFEDCFMVEGIMKGTLGLIQPVSLEPSPLEKTKFGEVMGIQEKERDNIRVKMLREVFDLYEKYGRKKFLSGYIYKTEYWDYPIEPHRGFKGFLEKHLPIIFKANRHMRKKRKIIKILQMYENMKTIKNLVPNAKNKVIRYSIWHPEDFPWAIDYFGYIKRRDGAHRRAIMAYFGSKTIDTVVVNFKKLTKDDLKDSIPYLKDNFEWFYNEVKEKHKNYSSIKGV